MNTTRRAILIVIDGWGIRREKEGNAIARALTPNYSRLLGLYPNTELEASGLPVGLPDGVMGNSEVGHMNIGSGRRVIQDQVRIHEAIDSGEFFQNEALRSAMHLASSRGKNLHLMGLVSQGNVHSAERHYLNLIDMCARENVPADRLFLHVALDGRDTPPRSAEGYLQTLEGHLKKVGGRIATVSGRFFLMDRDQRWERTDLAYQALVLGKGQTASSAMEALKSAYARNENDEFVQPTVINAAGRLQNGDVVICFNFRPDRMRQIVRALTDDQTPLPSLQKGMKVSVTSFTRYDKSFSVPVAFSPQSLDLCLGEVVSRLPRNQFRCAETEKYAHVTYFFNGGREEAFRGEDRLLIPSPKVKTYDLTPEMSSVPVTDAVVKRAKEKDDALIVVNFAHPDMVGHTGIFDAAVTAVESTDRCLGRIIEAACDTGFSIVLTADHGNVEMMVDPVTGEPHTAHTTNPVPLICIGPEMKKFRLKSGGALGDVAPTLLEMMGWDQPKEMTGQSLLIS